MGGSGGRAYRRAALHQVLHVPLDGMQVLLDVVEVLRRLVGPGPAAGPAHHRPLVLGRRQLLQRLVEGIPEYGKKIMIIIAIIGALLLYQQVSVICP